MYRRFLIFFFVLFLQPMTGFAADIAFGLLPRDIAVEEAPSAVATADFNDDGITDLAVASSSSRSVKILLGNGDGTFQAAKSLGTGVGTYPLSIAVADLNADGHPDLAVANGPSNTVSVLPGLGDGTFQPAENYRVGDYPASVAIGDLNGDGFPDLAVANEAGLNVSILLNSGAGFSAGGTYAVNARANQVVMGDLNVDGYLDLVVATGRGTVVSLIGHGDRTFVEVRNFYSSGVSGSWSSTIGNFNDDSYPDLAVANYYDNDVSILRGNGDGSFEFEVRYAVGTGPKFIENADFNVDGYADLAVLNYNSSSVSVLHGNGNGTFHRATHYATGYGPSFAAIADLNADGTPDLAVANWGNNVSLLFGNGDGTLQTPTHFKAGDAPVSIAVGDLNADGKADLVVADQKGSSVSILLGNGDGLFAPATKIAVEASPWFVALGDLNADGRLDLVVTNIRSASVSILLGQGDGTFFPAVNYSTGRFPVWVTIDDLDADGHPDLAIANNYSDSVSILLGYGDGTFRPAVNYVTGASTSSIAIGDYNSDGKLDLAVADRLNNSASLLFGNGDGTFKFYVPINIGGFDFDHGAFSIATADFDADGKLDLAVVKSDDNRLAVLRGNGDGTFQRPLDYVINGYYSPIVIEDFDRDGKLDLSVVNGRSVLILRGNGDGTFQTPVPYGAGLNTRAVANGDFNNDGLPDLAVANMDSDDVSILRNSAVLPKWNANYPQTGNITGSFAEILVNADRTGSAYLVCLPAGSVGLTSGQVRAGQNGDGAPLPASQIAQVSFNANNTATLTCTSLAEQSAYDLYTVAADNEGSLQAIPTKLRLVRPATGANLVSDTSSPQSVGSTITFTGVGIGGDAGPYEYRFWWRSTLAGSPWTIGQAYSSSATWSWETARRSLPAGSYYIQVDIRHVGNPAQSEAIKSLTYKLKTVVPATSVTLTPDLASPQSVGSAITFTGVGIGGDTGPYEYRFWWRSTLAGSLWTIGQAYSPSATWSWDSARSSLPAGSYYIQVDIRHVGNPAWPEAVKSLTYKLKTVVPATSVTLTPDLVTPQSIGTTITYTGAAIGGNADDYEYRFWWRSTVTGSPWSVGQAYSTRPSWEWKTAALGLPPGSYYLQVDTRHVGNPVRAEVIKTMQYMLK